MPQPRKPTFQIGLVMAGAVSAGAYTAGVLDFLFESLDHWYKRYNNDPPHDIKIKVMTGASAGGMCSGISTLQFADNTDFGKPHASKLYNSWVNLVDIGPMLTTDDLSDGNVKSLLNSDIIDQIADRAFEIKPSYSHVPPFVSDDYHLLLTVTNTRGVSYGVDFSTQTEGNPYTVTNYGDFFHFRIVRPTSEVPSIGGKYGYPHLLNLTAVDGREWQAFKEMCKATGAFPIGLKARVLEQSNVGVYENMFSTHRPVNVPVGKPYRYIGIDGGVVNNEPFEMAHDILAGGSERSNPRAPNLADRAVIMVDPFPITPVISNYNDTATDLTDVALAFFNSLMGQALFKPEDLQPAMDNMVRSRFLISPKRSTPQGSKGEYHLACGALGAFSGFIDRSFRLADYELGRRNAQRFIRRHFLLGEENPLYIQWKEEQKNELKILYGDLPAGELPVLPLDETLMKEISEPEWPQLSRQQLEAKIKTPIYKRTKSIGAAYIGNWLLRTSWNIQFHKLAGAKVYSTFVSALQDANLLK